MSGRGIIARASCALLAAISVLLPRVASTAQPGARPCARCAIWNQPQRPFRIYGNTYYVGVRSLSSILVTSDQGHILIDGDLPQSAPQIAEGFRFTRSRTYPNALQDFARSFTTLEKLPCDILLTPHPEASDFWDRMKRRDAGDQTALVDPGACRAYAERSRAALARRVAQEAD